MSRGNTKMKGDPAGRTQDLAGDRAPSPEEPQVGVCERMVAGGRGLVRAGGQVWLVEGLQPGERGRLRPLRRRGSVVEAELDSLLEPAPSRREAPCPLHRSCGGCGWMDAGEPHQRAWKTDLVAEALRRIGKLGDVPVEPTMEVPPALGYRNRIEWELGLDSGGRPVVGYHLRIGPGLLDVPQCLLLHPSGQAVAEAVRAWLLALKGQARQAWFGGRPRVRVGIRLEARSGHVWVVVRRGSRPLPAEDDLAASLAGHRPEFQGLVVVAGTGGRRGGARSRVVRGTGLVTEQVLGHTMRVPAASFFQAHVGGAEALARVVLDERVPGAPRVLDLYAGVGLFGRLLAAEGSQATLVEADGDAVAAARRDTARGGGGPVEVVRDDAGRFLARAAAAGRRWDLVVANPPRRGLDRNAPGRLAQVATRRIVMVSCDPPTLARDVASLHRHGWRVRRVRPLDLFPQTPHVETVVSLEPTAG